MSQAKSLGLSWSEMGDMPWRDILHLAIVAREKHQRAMSAADDG